MTLTDDICTQQDILSRPNPSNQAYDVGAPSFEFNAGLFTYDLVVDCPLTQTFVTDPLVNLFTPVSSSNIAWYTNDNNLATGSGNHKVDI